VKQETVQHRITPLGNHDRAAFSCGKEPLDRYIREIAGQDVKRKLTAVFVLTADDSPRTIQGYYTLSSREVRLSVLPSDLAKKAGRYDSLPATLLGRLAVDSRHHGHGFGEILLIDALKRSLQSTTEVGSFGVLVEAIDEEARRFYEKYDFRYLEKNKLFLPMTTIGQVFIDGV
jgi:GNAT superfamily N-acetyltransferase